MAELRKDPVAGNWVVVGYAPTKKTSTPEVCPFCPGNESCTPYCIKECRIDRSPWNIRVVQALNSVFVVEADSTKRAEGLYDKMGNVGAHEIIIEHCDHSKRLSTFTENELLLLLDTYIERIIDLKKDQRFRYILVFRNYGELAGSFIPHPHSHVLATPVMPKRIDLELTNSLAHYQRKERCLFCDIIHQEISENKRIVTINENFVVLAPFASRFPFETWILPKFHEDSFEDLTNINIKRELASTLADLVRRLEKFVPAYAILLHTSPNTYRGIEGEEIPISDYFHWHIEVLPKDSRIAKYRTEDEFYAIPDTPEEAARLLRDVTL